MAPEFYRIHSELQRLQFSDTPDYDYFVGQLQSIATRKKYRDTDPFDWEYECEKSKSVEEFDEENEYGIGEGDQL